MGLVRGAVCHYCLGGCSAELMCALSSWQVRVSGPMPALAFPPLVSPSSLALLVVRVACCPVRVSPPSPAGTPFPPVCAFRVLGPVALPVRAACVVCVCALLLQQHTRPCFQGPSGALNPRGSSAGRR